MTTSNARTEATPTRFRLPEPPERELDEVTSYRHIYAHGHPLHLARHFGKPESTLVVADLWISAHPGYAPLRRPDLLIAFDVDPELYYENNGYLITDQGKPPDFVLEVASPSTALTDIGPKREEYAALGITEYWRFDDTGELHGSRLAGDRLVGGSYVPIEITEISPNVLEGFSEAIQLRLRWDHGDLKWHDPATGQHIPTFDDEREARIAERAARFEAETRAERERVARMALETRVRELEVDLMRSQEERT